jgi:hypothetical protein
MSQRNSGKKTNNTKKVVSLTKRDVKSQMQILVEEKLQKRCKIKSLIKNYAFVLIIIGQILALAYVAFVM